MLAVISDEIKTEHEVNTQFLLNTQFVLNNVMDVMDVTTKSESKVT